MQKHIKTIGVAASIFLITITGLNGLVDPYKIWNVLEIKGINSEKSELAAHERIFKIVGLAQRPANTVILGTSRSDIGLDPLSSALGQGAINLAISSQSYRETRLLFEQQIKREPSKAFVIGLDFFAANNLLRVSPDVVAENYMDGRSQRLLFSLSSTTDAFKTLIKRAVAPGDLWSAEGLRLWSAEKTKLELGHRQFMRNSEKGYLASTYAPLPTCDFDFEPPKSGLSPLDEIRAVFARAHETRIPLKLLISPSHARQWETLAAAGLWGKWEGWKHRLVTMNEEEARRAGQPPFPLWDFSGYNSISTETVPPLGDTQTMMRWYFDSSHYTPAAGDLVLDRIFNFKSPDRIVPDDFGVLLTSQTIEVHLARIRSDRERYRQTHSQDVAEIEAMAREVAKTKRCKPTQL